MAKKPESRPKVKPSRIIAARFRRALALARVLDLRGNAGQYEHAAAGLEGEILKARELLATLVKSRAFNLECAEGFASDLPAALNDFEVADAECLAAGAPRFKDDELCKEQRDCELDREVQIAREFAEDYAPEKGGAR